MIIGETILLLSVSTAVAVEAGTEPRVPTSAPVLAAQSATAPDGDDRVAVAVFSNISGAAEDDWIGTGIVETLMATLEGVDGVSVVERQAVSGALERLGREGGSTEATEGTEVAAGRLLGARWVISGGYQRLGDRMRITARVVEVVTATVVHASIVDGLVPELFALQDRLAVDLRRGLRAREGAGTRAAATPAQPASRWTPPADRAAAAPVAVAEPSRGGGVAARPTSLIDGPRLRPHRRRLRAMRRDARPSGRSG